MTNVLMDKSVWEEINKRVFLTRGNREIGGIYLGYRRQTTLHIVQATYPSTGDICKKYAFHRLSRHHQEIATQAWIKSNHEIDWLGEWHSHPENHPSPSGVDKKSWKKITRRHKNNMFFSIHGYEENWKSIASFSRYKQTSLNHCRVTDSQLLFTV